MKILDFGLAKALEPEPLDARPDMTQSPTMTAAATRRGQILGTGAYMSPEQATGKSVDERTDIWAFGVSLFEMLTGRSPFHAGDSVESLARVLEREPDWDRLPSSLPATVGTFLRRCLHKDPRERVRHIGDVALSLRGAFEVVDEGEGRGGGSVSRAAMWQRGARMVMIGVLAAIAGGLLGGRLGRESSPSLPTSRFKISIDDAGSTYPGYFGLALSRDGRSLVYTGSAGPRVRSLGDLHSRAIPNAGGFGTPFLSPDGSQLGFVLADALKTVPLQGGNVVTVCSCRATGASWGPDGRIVFGSPTGLYQVAAEGGEPQRLTQPSQGEHHVRPRWLPRGNGILFTVDSGSASEQAGTVAPPPSRVAVLSLADGSEREIVEGRGAAYSLGHVVFGRGSSLWAAPFDEERLVLTGEPFVVAVDVDVTNLPRVPRFDLAEDGTLVYLPTSAQRFRGKLEAVWVDREGNETSLGVEIDAMGDTFYVPRISPDGRSIAVDVADRGNRDVWTIDLQRMSPTRRTFDLRNDRYPIWTPDSSRLIWGRDRGLFWQAADGAGSPEQITDSPNVQLPFDVTPDGATLVFGEIDPEENAWDIGILSLAGTGGTRMIVQDPGGQYNPELSPDGRWLAYESSDRSYTEFGVGSAEIIVRPFPTASGRWQVSQGAGRWPLWGPDGRELFYRSSEGIVRVEIATEPSFRHGRAELLVPLDPVYFGFGAGPELRHCPRRKEFSHHQGARGVYREHGRHFSDRRPELVGCASDRRELTSLYRPGPRGAFLRCRSHRALLQGR